MARLVLSNVVSRGERGNPRTVTSESVLPMFGHKSVNRCWSGLYGTASTREGLMFLLKEPVEPLAIVRVACEVAGGVVTRMGLEDPPRLGYLNVRYADADLNARIDGIWSALSGVDDPREACLTRPDLARRVLQALGIKGVFVIIHPFRVHGTSLVLSVGTVLDPRCVVDVKSREPGLTVTLAAK